MYVAREHDKIGDKLVAKNLIAKEELEKALSLQEACGSKLGKILIGQGNLTTFQFHQALAEHLELPFVDLIKEPSDPVLLEEEERQNYLHLRAVPWKKQGKMIVLATAEITQELEDWAHDKFRHHQFVITSPFDIFWTVQKHFSSNDDEDARELLWRHKPRQSAKFLFMTSYEKYTVLLAGLVLLGLMYFDTVLVSVFVVINVFYCMTLLCKLLFFGAGMWADKQHCAHASEPLLLTCFPVYTLLVPLYHEKEQTIQHLIEAIRALDYPKSRLDVKLVVEADDDTTIEIIKQQQCESYFEIVRVPYSLPRTKPKACNYALKFARGEYVTIYDAEDWPDPKQLKKVLQVFSQSSKEVVCVQAKLNYYNRRENILTRMFSLEYSSWFNYMLRGLEVLKIPVPLGGTSNHFPTHILRQLCAWDPYNVTEDADLGIRLAQEGYKTAMVESVTLEEAPVSLGAWIRQRSRWIKGYMQTYIVHMRHPLQLWQILGGQGFFGFLFFVGAPAVVFLTIPFIVLLSLLMLVYPMEFPDWFVNFALVNFVAGVGVHIAIAWIVIKRHQWWDMAVYSLLFPFYWLLHSVASFKAASQLITRPHYWEKTEHGVSNI